MAIIEFTMTSVFVFYDNVILRQYYVFYYVKEITMLLRNIFFFMYIKTWPLISNPKRTKKTPFISATTSILVEKQIWQLSACWVIK